MILFFMEFHLIVCAFCVLVSLGANILGQWKSRKRVLRRFHKKCTGRKIKWSRKVLTFVTTGALFLLPVFNIIMMFVIIILNFASNETFISLVKRAAYREENDETEK